MTYVVISHYECIGVGSLIPDDEEFRLFESLKNAEDWFLHQMNSISTKVTQELAEIASNSSLQFDSPYVVWMMILHIPNKLESDIEPTAVISKLFPAANHFNCPEIRKCVKKYSGDIFEPKQKDYALENALEYLDEYFG